MASIVTPVALQVLPTRGSFVETLNTAEVLDMRFGIKPNVKPTTSRAARSGDGSGIPSARQVSIIFFAAFAGRRCLIALNLV